MFEVGEYVVCPGHGVAQIDRIEKKDLGGSEVSFLVLRIVANGMTVMVPVNSNSGVRSLVNDDQIDDVFTLLSDHDVTVDNSTWNRRYRDYMNKIKTGSILEIADVLRSLFLLKERKTLSFGEKKMLDQCRELLTQEISLSGGIEPVKIHEQIEACF